MFFLALLSQLGVGDSSPLLEVLLEWNLTQGVKVGGNKRVFSCILLFKEENLSLKHILDSHYFSLARTELMSIQKPIVDKENIILMICLDQSEFSS